MSDAESALSNNAAAAMAIKSWAMTKDRAARTAPARRAARERFIRQAVEIHGGDAAPEVIEEAARLLELAFMRDMSAKSAKARAARKAQAEGVGE